LKLSNYHCYTSVATHLGFSIFLSSQKLVSQFPSGILVGSRHSSLDPIRQNFFFFADCCDTRIV